MENPLVGFLIKVVPKPMPADKVEVTDLSEPWYDETYNPCQELIAVIHYNLEDALKNVTIAVWKLQGPVRDTLATLYLISEQPVLAGKRPQSEYARGE